MRPRKYKRMSFSHRHIIRRICKKLTPPSIQKRSDLAGVTVLLLHGGGEPRTNFYAKEHIVRQLQRQFGVPKWISSLPAEAYLKCSNLPSKCVAASSTYPFHLDELEELASGLQRSLATLVPEFGPIRCLPVSSQEESAGLDRQLELAFRHGLDLLVVLCLSPLFQHENKLFWMLAQLDRRIRAQSSRLPSTETGDVPQFVMHNSPNSFSLLQIERLANTESLVQYFADRLVPLLDKYEALVFVAPYLLRRFRLLRTELDNVAQRIMHAAYKASPRSTPWRTAFYSPWDLPFAGWANINRQSLPGCLHKIRANIPRRGPVLVVPMDSLFRSFDTETMLPQIVEDCSLPAVKGASFVDILAPDPLGDRALVHSLAEIVKYAVLNQKKFTVPEVFQQN